MITAEDFVKLRTLIEDGELDDYMIDLQGAIDERNSRRKDDILRLVKTVWGQNAVISSSGPPVERAGEGKHAMTPEEAQRAPLPYEPDTGPQVPAGQADSMGAWPTPVESAGGGGDIPTGEQPVFSPVSDPMAAGGSSDPFGDGDPNIVSTGARIG